MKTITLGVLYRFLCCETVPTDESSQIALIICGYRRGLLVEVKILKYGVIFLAKSDLRSNLIIENRFKTKILIILSRFHQTLGGGVREPKGRSLFCLSQNYN